MYIEVRCFLGYKSERGIKLVPLMYSTAGRGAGSSQYTTALARAPHAKGKKR